MTADAFVGCIARVGSRKVSFANPHAEIDLVNLEQDRAIAAALRRNPKLIQMARENLERWLNNDGGAAHPALLEWTDILFFLKIADFLESETPKANRLRQSSPFVGILRRAAAEAMSRRAGCDDELDQSAEELFPQVYVELRLLAARRLAKESPGQTLQLMYRGIT